MAHVHTAGLSFGFNTGYQPAGAYRCKKHHEYQLRCTPSKRKKREWRLGPVTDQGYSSTCVAHATVAWLRSFPRPIDFVPIDGLYESAQRWDEDAGERYEGTSLLGSMTALMKLGIISNYYWCRDKETMLYHILKRGPLLLAIHWFSGMMETDANGFVHPTGRKPIDMHAVVAYGVNVPEEYVSIRLSSGENFGDKGNVKMSFADVETSLRMPDAICCAPVKTRLTN